MRASKVNSAFSLIELSIVILVIGILISGIIGGEILMTKFRVLNAQTLTQSSPVSSIKGLHAWYETTSQKSFDSAVVANNSPVTEWYDLNTQKTPGLKLTQSTASSKPTYNLKSLNSLPTVSFDGGDSLASIANFDMTGNPSFTSFVVARVRGGNWGTIFAAGTNQTCNSVFLVANNGLIYTAFKDVGQTYSHDTMAASSKFAIHVWAREANNVNNNLTGNTAFVNGKRQTLVDLPNPCTPNISTSTLSVGSFGTFGSYLIGDIAEIIIFDRALKATDREPVEQYLSKKWAIKL